MTRLAAVALSFFFGYACAFATHGQRANPPAPAMPLPIRACDRDLSCGCWACGETEADRRAMGAPAAVCQQRYYVPCGKVDR